MSCTFTKCGIKPASALKKKKTQSYLQDIIPKKIIQRKVKMSDLMSKINSNGDTQAESHMSDLCDRNPLELKQDYLSDPSRIGSFKHNALSTCKQ